MLLVFVGGVWAAVWTLRIRARPDLLIRPLLLGASTLGLAVALVALDSATYRQVSPETADCTAWTETSQVYFLYPVWGVLLAVTLLQALRAVNVTRRVKRLGA